MPVPSQQIGRGTSSDPSRLRRIFDFLHSLTRPNGDFVLSDITIGKGGTGDNTNSAFGRNALENNTGVGNIAVGNSALQANTTGFQNAALGNNALKLNTTGQDNVAVGNFALDSNTDGDNNVGVGSGALSANTSGQDNVGVGYVSLSANDTGDNNTAIGRWSLSSNTSGSNNTAVGYAALEDNATGSGSVAVGQQAGRYQANGLTPLTTATNSIFIGRSSRGTSAASLTNAIVVGDAAISKGDNTTVVGNTSTTKTYTFGHRIGEATAGITASTTQTQGQGALTSDVNEVSTVANANDTCTLPTAEPAMTVTVINNGANTMQLFPASGDNLGAGVDTATTIAASAHKRFQSYDATNWVDIS